MPRTILLAAALSVFSALAADKPPKPDLPYLLHGSNLVPTEIKEAKEERKGDETVYTIAGATSSAKTPLPEPRFIVDAQTIAPEHMGLFKADVRDNLREVTLTAKRKKGGTRPLHLTVFPLGGKLYRLEAAEELEEGEYCLSPSESNRVFCFAVY